MNSKSFYKGVGEVFFLLFLTLFFAGFYITDFSSSSFSSILRVFLVIGFVLLFFINNAEGLRGKLGCENKLLHLNNYLYVGVSVFFLYILVSSVFFHEWAIFRRAIVILFFLLIVWLYSLYLRFDYARLIYSLGFFGFIVGVFYLHNYLVLSDFLFSGYRNNPVQSTGFSWLASYDNTITAALHISFLCIAAVWSFFNSKNRVASIFYYLAFFVLLLAIVLTFARTAWVAMFSSLLVFFIHEVKRNKLKVFSLYSVLLVMGLVYIVFFFNIDMARGLTYRDETWAVLLDNIQSVKGWVFGMGPAASVSFAKLPGGGFSVHAHNIYVETLYRNGLLGLLLFLLLLFVVVRNLFVFVNDRERVFFTAILCGAGVAMFFDFSNLIYSPNLIWLWVWFPVAVSLSGRRVN